VANVLVVGALPATLCSVFSGAPAKMKGEDGTSSSCIGQCQATLLACLFLFYVEYEMFVVAFGFRRISEE
jgi:hypothetical protein